MDVLIKELDPAVHAELVRRARASDMSLRAYLREVLAAHVATMSTEKWLSDLQRLDAVDAGGTTGADLVAAARAEADAPTR